MKWPVQLSTATQTTVLSFHRQTCQRTCKCLATTVTVSLYCVVGLHPKPVRDGAVSTRLYGQSSLDH